MHFTKYPKHLRTIYHEGKKIDVSEYKPDHDEYINGILICTCGKTLTNVNSIYSHRKTKYHLANHKS
jgi:hypothetical protein